MKNNRLFDARVYALSDDAIDMLKNAIEGNETVDSSNSEGTSVEVLHIELPEKVIINKNATILFWNNGEKIVVKRAKDDKYNKVLGFLYAWFYKTSGLSRNEAKKYLKSLKDEDDLKKEEIEIL